MLRKTGYVKTALSNNTMKLNLTFPGAELISITISFSNDVITGIEFLPLKPDSNATGPDILERKTTIAESGSFPGTVSEQAAFSSKITQQINAYFLNSKYRFSLPCKLQLGTQFQQKVWQALLQIPSGQVKTYGELAKELNTSPRAVGNACRHNPFPLVVPCHRVVSASGVGGYAGDTLTTQKGAINYLQIKQWLLIHEKASIE
ncbi:MAG: methylated-DNA--[protein]-cysteine S-methyltransferase [Gammaproteobacteria bacterium]|nr:methylated-DNA--[protein]-cysteine S-methyltransferase [Gammaproteobacteria bacterium]